MTTPGDDKRYFKEGAAGNFYYSGEGVCELCGFDGDVWVTPGGKLCNKCLNLVLVAETLMED